MSRRSFRSLFLLFSFGSALATHTDSHVLCGRAYFNWNVKNLTCRGPSVSLTGTTFLIPIHYWYRKKLPGTSPTYVINNIPT